MINIIRGLLYFVVLVLIQTLLLNNIHFIRLITPMLYVYFIIKLPVGYSSVRITFFSFLIGFTIDILSNTQGMHAAACTLAGFLRPYIIRLFIREDLPENIEPSFRSFGYLSFISFTVLLITIHHLALFFIESLTLFNLLFFTIRVLAGVLMTTIFICIVEAFHKEYKRSGD